MALTGEGGLDGITPPLTSLEALAIAAIAAIAAELTGREITRVTVPDDQWVAGLTSHGVREQQARLLLGVFEASRQGEFAAVSPALGDLLGRTPVTFHEQLEATLPN